MRAVCAILLFALYPATQQAKGDDTAVWKNFELIASRNVISPGALRINLPPAQDGSLADILNRNSALFVKYYSPGSLASTSMRGMGAQHTAVMWNGINLQSSMNSNMDLNLLPAFFIDQAAIETGANANTSGNGAIAGAILLNNDISSRKRVFAELGYGSFNQQNYGAGFSTGYKKFSSTTRFLMRTADNNFLYRNIFLVDKPFEKMQNNRFNQNGFMQEFGFRFKQGHTLYANIMHLETRRQLPPVMGASANAEERQDDFNTMAVIRHELKLDTRSSLNSRLAFISEEINYYNKLLQPAFNDALSYIMESEYKLQLKKGIEYLASANYTRQHAETDGYRDGINRHLFSMVNRLSFQLLNPNLRLSLAARQLIANGNTAPLSPDFGFEWQLNKKYKLKGNAAVTYRIPSFNDLYWLPGGNPKLEPEKGKKAELSIEHKNKYFKTGATVFMHRIDNWIMWMPDAASSNWKAVNAKQVQSHGAELALDARYTFNPKLALRFFGRYQYVRSVNSDVYGEDKSNTGKILMYTPLHTGSATVQLSAGKYRLNTVATYTGGRYTGPDNHPDNYLNSFFLLNAGISRNMNFKKFSSVLEFSVNNLLNKSYTVFEYRPMPLRNYLITYKININYE